MAAACEQLPPGKGIGRGSTSQPPPFGLHTTATSAPEPSSLLPTITPPESMPSAWLLTPPGSVGRNASTCPGTRQLAARGLASRVEPTISPASFTRAGKGPSPAATPPVASATGTAVGLAQVTGVATSDALPIIPTSSPLAFPWSTRPP
jgi:hypothetical protein